MEKFYPNGTVVAVKNPETNEEIFVMIFGRLFKHENIKGIIDYVGFVHPFGFQGMDNVVYFNENQIEKVIFMGYQDLLESEYVEFLKIKLAEKFES